MPLFDKEASHYDAFFKTPIGEFVDEVEKQGLFENFTVRKGMRILEIGAGTGTLTLELAKRGASVTAIDISPEMIEVAIEKAAREGQDITFEVMDAHALDFDDEAFDAVISMATLEFLSSPTNAYQEMKRVVKEDGMIIIGTINKDSDWGALYMSDAFKDTVFAHAGFKNADELKALDPGNLELLTHCLFTHPKTEEENLTHEREASLSETDKEGGFLWAHFRKRG